MIIFTSICANYLHKARTLADSVKAYMPDAHFVVCLVEREVKPEYAHASFDEIVLAKDAWEGNFDQFIYKHAIVEASTAVKGQFFRYLYKAYPNETQYVYLDPDCCVYGDLLELKEKLKTRPIVLCPHLLQPGNIPMELSSTAHGVYNLGFLGVNGSEEAKRFIDWWADRLRQYCYDDIQNGVFTDQKWIDLAPCFFDVEIFRHRGYDFATWSLLDCGLTCENGAYFVKGDPLRFIHFSGYGRVIEQCMNDWLPEGQHPFRDLYAEYSKKHEANNADGISKSIWSYQTYESGEIIKDKLRIGYRANPDVMNAIENPFALSNAEISDLIHKATWGSLIRTKYRKAMQILKEDGIIALMKKIWKKICAKIN
ncbi:MAG: hypothetical protein IKV90_09835 [Clostridia bacterium]|nr:hypothetical protein [Clostridia bacterium]